MGAMFFAVLGVAGQIERNYIREKTLEGQVIAASKGNHGGRPKVIDDDMLTFAVALKDKGVPVPEIAKKLTIKVGKDAGKSPSVASSYRALAEAEAAAVDDGELTLLEPLGERGVLVRATGDHDLTGGDDAYCPGPRSVPGNVVSALSKRLTATPVSWSVPTRTPTTVVRRDGREPLGLGSAINRMMTERGMVAPAAGGSVLASFDTILAAVVPELAGRVQAVAFDAGTGRLDVVPDVPACGTQLRWSAPKLVAEANERVSGANVRALHVLTPAPVTPAPLRQPPKWPRGRPRPSRRCSGGLRRRATAVRSRRTARPRCRPGSTRASSRRWSGRTRRRGRCPSRAFPEPPVVPNDAPAPIDQARVQRRRQAAMTEADALRRARAERAGAVLSAPRPRQTAGEVA
ncbi:DciA family protein [Streptomyces sp. CB00316]|uniref:DciA family protein n=1 Tax=Streptomyces sp. CB00316 TaxID=1703932 RepID=UPI000AC249BB|nr:DciA family protein [Streptomyces sp. CB00316]